MNYEGFCIYIQQSKHPSSNYNQRKKKKTSHPTRRGGSVCHRTSHQNEFTANTFSGVKWKRQSRRCAIKKKLTTKSLRVQSTLRLFHQHFIEKQIGENGRISVRLKSVPVKLLMKPSDMAAGKTLIYLWLNIMCLCHTLVKEYECRSAEDST